MIYRIVLLILLSLIATASRAQDFPKTDEINLLLTQTERATQVFATLVDREEQVLGNDDKDAVAKDRKIIKDLQSFVKTLKAQPDAFNSLVGFSIQLWLDDADRNALLCQITALAKLSNAKNTSNARDLLELAQASSSASALLYTVSETASDLYVRYLNAEKNLMDQASETLDRCNDALKKRKSSPR